MRKLVISLVVSLDGFISGPGGAFVEPEWSADLDGWTDRMAERFDTLIYGRNAWERMAEYWPNAPQAEGNAAARRLVALMNGARKLVFSRSLGDVSAWTHSELADGAPEVVLAREKAKDGKDMVVFAGAGMAQTALRTGLVDELWLLTVPALAGSGLRLFDGSTPAAGLELAEVVRMDTGAIFTRHLVRSPE